MVTVAQAGLRKAAAKRTALLTSMPEEWHLGPDRMYMVEHQRYITDVWIQQYLDDKDVAIIKMDSEQRSSTTTRRGMAGP